jgi:hypothetical protein
MECIKVTILWYQKVKTDRTIPKNKPDIIIGDNNKNEHVCQQTLQFKDI